MANAIDKFRKLYFIIAFYLVGLPCLLNLTLFSELLSTRYGLFYVKNKIKTFYLVIK